MIRAGETSGNLDKTLDDLATTIEKQVELRGKIRSALTYPIVVLALVLGILLAMLLFIVPMFKKMYAELGGKLPPATQVLITISNICIHAMPVVIVGAHRRDLRVPPVGSHRGGQGHSRPDPPPGPDLRWTGAQDGHGPLRFHAVHAVEVGCAGSRVARDHR